ncbi:hypothetical protein ENSA5_00870 [Enhygromyxa salina]|uniref:Lipoprotein n=1 Tax=Enhygromyxa salina TaxID=215803 RepID=A0A2S9YKX8_9BACT|nr:hypothetical protein [Enhygromyxa salina]PRQ05767.1 hypothetical protein ENSA5_00870 [Enhygromyxa salina]
MPIRQRVLVSLAAAGILALGCTSQATSQGSAPPDPDTDDAAPRSSSAPPAAEPGSAEVCVHFMELIEQSLGEGPGLSATARATLAAKCVVDLDNVRRNLEPSEHRRRVTCLMAADKLTDTLECQPFAAKPADLEPSPPPPAPSGEYAMQPLSQLMSNAVHAPNPDPAALQQTKAARFDKADGVTVVAFCVDTTGETSDIHTAQNFPAIRWSIRSCVRP